MEDPPSLPFISSQDPSSMLSYLRFTTALRIQRLPGISEQTPNDPTNSMLAYLIGTCTYTHQASARSSVQSNRPRDRRDLLVEKRALLQRLHSLVSEEEKVC